LGIGLLDGAATSMSTIEDMLMMMMLLNERLEMMVDG